MEIQSVIPYLNHKGFDSELYNSSSHVVSIPVHLFSVRMTGKIIQLMLFSANYKWQQISKFLCVLFMALFVSCDQSTHQYHASILDFVHPEKSKFIIKTLSTKVCSRLDYHREQCFSDIVSTN